METITVFGAGSWGTALADLAARRGHDVVLWCRHEDQARAINATGHNPRYLSDAPLNPSLNATSDIEEAVAHSARWILAIPTQALRETLLRLAPLSPPGVSACNAAKGIEICSRKLIHEIVKEILPQARYSVLSGPSHAEEVIKGQPTAVVVASSDNREAEFWQGLLNGGTFRVYTGTDVVGVEVGGAVKNVMAVAAGVARAMGLGDNAVAALVSRGLAETMRLGARLGARPLTLAGLAGVGDLMVTCYSHHSRNFRLGLALGEGLSLDAALENLGQVAEGATTVKAVVALARELNVDLPLAEAIHRVLYDSVPPARVLEALFLRDPKPELPPGLDWDAPEEA
ncbi:MAG: NAD(P)H-dependent glycerol-3-phosphate dehydrogenase [Synergistales bacterium]